MSIDVMKRSVLSPNNAQRMKLCIFAVIISALSMLTVFVKDSKHSNHPKKDDSFETSLLVPVVPSFSKLANDMNPNNFVWHNKYDLVHVVQTDFLQYHIDLVHLNEARLGLFETFTIPSMKQQSNKEFLWIIFTDSNLRRQDKQQLIKLVSDFPNVVVLGFRRDRKVDFRDLNGMDEDEIGDAMVTGSRKLLLDYHKASQNRLLIETRLDGDDALNKDYIESIQKDASSSIGKSDLRNDYRIFCAEHHVEWRYYKPRDEDAEEGHLVHYHNPDFCINSGMTVGYQVDARARHLATLEQSNMNTWYLKCIIMGYDGAQAYNIPGTPYIRHYCVSSTTVRRLGEAHEGESTSEPDSQIRNSVLMARTPAAAGMKRVLGTEASYKKTFESIQAQQDAWKMVEEDFGVKKDKVIELRRRMEKNIENILRNALEGQCMPGHSCKASSKRKLLKLLKKVSKQDKDVPEKV